MICLNELSLYSALCMESLVCWISESGGSVQFFIFSKVSLNKTSMIESICKKVGWMLLLYEVKAPLRRCFMKFSAILILFVLFFFQILHEMNPLALVSLLHYYHSCIQIFQLNHTSLNRLKKCLGHVEEDSKCN